jgi:cell division inhibitor SepF
MKLSALFKSDGAPLEFIPDEFDVVQNIANQILNGGEAIVDLTRLTKEDARRTTDFLSGLIYAVGGKVKKLGRLKYHFFPS